MWVIVPILWSTLWPALHGVQFSPPPASAAAGTQPSAPIPTPAELEAFARLITGDNTSEARKLGAAKLIDSGTEDGARLLRDILVAPEPNLSAQMAVCQAIAESARPMPALVEPLLALLGDTRPGVNEAVSRALRRFESGPVVERLGPLALDESIEQSRRLAAIMAMGALGDDLQCARRLADLLKHKSPIVKATALRAFSQATGVAHDNGASALVWWKARENLTAAQWSKEVLEGRRAQVTALRADREELTRRLVAAYREGYLKTPEPERTTKTLGFLTDDLAAVRGLGLELINGLITDRREVGQELRAQLTEMITDPDPAVRLLVAQIVGDLRLAAAAGKLRVAPAQEPDPLVRAAQINALGRLDDEGAVDPLIEWLQDESPVVVGEAALALGTLGRRGEADPVVVEAIASALAARYKTLGETQEDVRVKFLSAMTRIRDDSFRSIFMSEMSPGRSVLIRRAAIAGLATYGDDEAGDAVRELVKASELEIRLAAAEALGQCGRRRQDLAALESHLYPRSEADPLVRQKAWESFVAITQRLSPQEQVSVSDEFDRPDDRVAQKYRLDLLKAFKANTTIYEQLERWQRIRVIEKMADAQLALGEYSAAATSFDQAFGLASDEGRDDSDGLAVRSVKALLLAHEDAGAIKRLRELTDGDRPNGEVRDLPGLYAAILDEVRLRTEAATDATGFTSALNLLDLARGLPAQAGDAYEAELRTLRRAAMAKREAQIDRLLTAGGDGAEVEARLIAFGREVLLPRVAELLEQYATGDQASNAPQVAKLVKLARRVLPDWEGFDLDTPDEDRIKAIDALRAAAASQPAAARG